MPDLTELKQKHRATWAAGDYDQIAQGIKAVADHVVRSGRIRAGELVLDVACGTGNTALMARARNAVVTGLDLTPNFSISQRSVPRKRDTSTLRGRWETRKIFHSRTAPSISSSPRAG